MAGYKRHRTSPQTYNSPAPLPGTSSKMERTFLLLLSLTFIATFCQAQLDSFNDLSRDYGLVYEPRPSDALLRLKRASGDDDDQGTELCSAQQLRVVAESHFECNQKAESTLKLALNSDKNFDVFATLCQVIQAKVGCINTIAPSCLKPDRVNIMKLNYLAEQAAKAKNSSSLGQYFIDSCPELRNYQNELVQIVYGSSKCSYAQALDYKNTLDLCQNNTSTNFDRKVNLVADFLQSAPKEERL